MFANLQGPIRLKLMSPFHSIPETRTVCDGACLVTTEHDRGTNEKETPMGNILTRATLGIRHWIKAHYLAITMALLATHAGLSLLHARDSGEKDLSAVS